MYNDQAVQCTWEGDNTILSLQSGRSLIASYAEALAGKPQVGGTAYLNDLPAVLTISCPSDAATTSLDTLDAAWACVAANVVKRASESYDSHLVGEVKKDEALEKCSQERFIAAKVHTTGYIYRSVHLLSILRPPRLIFADDRQFRTSLLELEKTEPASNGVVAMLELICRLYGLWAVEENAQYFLKYRFFSPEQMDIISHEVSLCAPSALD